MRSWRPFPITKFNPIVVSSTPFASHIPRSPRLSFNFGIAPGKRYIVLHSIGQCSHSEFHPMEQNRMKSIKWLIIKLHWLLLLTIFGGFGRTRGMERKKERVGTDSMVCSRIMLKQLWSCFPDGYFHRNELELERVFWVKACLCLSNDHRPNETNKIRNRIDTENHFGRAMNRKGKKKIEKQKKNNVDALCSSFEIALPPRCFIVFVHCVLVAKDQLDHPHHIGGFNQTKSV